MCFYCFLSHLSDFGIAIRKRIGKLEKKNPQNLIYLSFCCCSVVSWVRLSVTPWTAERQASLSITSSQSLLKLRFIQPVTPSYHLILCRPLLLLPLTFPRIRVFVFQKVRIIKDSLFHGSILNFTLSGLSLQVI